MREVYCPLCTMEHSCEVVKAGDKKVLYYCEYTEGYFTGGKDAEES